MMKPSKGLITDIGCGYGFMAYMLHLMANKRRFKGIDYDKNKNYRLLVTQGKTLTMYDASGQSVSGFNYKNNGSTISSQPKHFRVGSKAYIVFAAGDALKILNRQGNNRVAVPSKIRFSENAIYLYQNKFTTTNILGQLVQVDTKGQLNLKNNYTELYAQLCHTSRC